VGVALGLIRARTLKDEATREVSAPVPADAQCAALPEPRPALDLTDRAGAVRDALNVT
jgi:hypothetical protein